MLSKFKQHLVISSVIQVLPLPTLVAIFQHHQHNYGVYISQLIRYSRACAQYSDFLDRAQLLT